MGRAPCCDKANVKKGPWSPEEDSQLKNHIEKHGTGGNWITLPQKAGLRRCGKSCRLRWLNYLRPNIKHGEFSPEEDRIICTLFATIGSRWSIIAAQLPGRTDNDIKNYWNTKLKKKLLGNGNAMKPHDHHHYAPTPIYRSEEENFINPTTTTAAAATTTAHKYRQDYDHEQYNISMPFNYYSNAISPCLVTNPGFEIDNEVYTCTKMGFPESCSSKNSSFIPNNGFEEENQKVMVSVTNSDSFGKEQIDYYCDLEDVKQLISSSNNNNNNNNNNGLFDQNYKPAGEATKPYYYYY